MNASSIDLKKLLCVTSDSNKRSTEKNARVSYSKETLTILAGNSPCKTRPECLSADCLGDDGRWDPEKWHQLFEPINSIEGAKRQMEHHDFDDESSVVLGPQRRSFQGGCHVVSKEKTPSLTFTRSGLSSATSRLSDRSLKLSRQQESDHHPHLKRFHSFHSDSNEWSKKDSDNKKSFEKSESSFRKTRNDYKRYSSTTSSSRKYSENSYHDTKQDYYEETEPEWLSYGPKSQFDTIELSGFEGADDFSWMGGEIPMDDVPDRKKKEQKSEEKPLIEKDQKAASSTKKKALEKKDTSKTQLEKVNGSLIEEGKAKSTDQSLKSDSPSFTTHGKLVEQPQESEVMLSLDEEIFGSDLDSNQESRFSLWFNSDSSITQEQKLVDELTDKASENVNESVTSTEPQASEQPKLIKPIPQRPNKPFNAHPADVHGADAFNRLIASIRASDKVKEKMQERNEKIQALQTMMNANSQRPTGPNVASIENSGDTKTKNALKQQLEKQKDLYQQKLKQIEQQQQKSSPVMFSGQEGHSLQMKQGLISGFSSQSTKDAVDERKVATASLAAKLAAKGRKEDLPKSQSNPALVDRLYAHPGKTQIELINEKALKEQESLMKLKRLHSNSIGQANNKTFPLQNALQNNLKNNSLVIAQMLAKAGVTEEQLKQLTLEQQELVIKMVQSQFIQQDSAKTANFNAQLVNASGAATGGNKNQLQTNTFVSSSLRNVNPVTTKPLLVSRDLLLPNNAASTSSTTHAFSYAEKPVAHSFINGNTTNKNVAAMQAPNFTQASAAQSALLSHNLISINPAAASSVLPLMSPSMASRVLAPTAMATPPHLAHLVQAQASLAPPHPALLLQMQQQVYANQLAAAQQQQQQAALAAIQKQQLAAAQTNDAWKLQQSIQNLRLARSQLCASDMASAQERTQFSNPLSQWFSRDVLRQTQFPPVSQLTGQQTMKLSNNPNGVEPLVNNSKH